MKTFLTKYIRPAVVITLIFAAVTGLLYPGVVTGLAQLLFHSQANGSLVYASNGQAIGSDLIGQYWTSPKYFHGRPSATTDLNGNPQPYNAGFSSASNLGPTNKVLIQTVQQRVAKLEQENPDAPPGPIPVDLVTTSGSGLDPDITLAAALYQVPRIAAARPELSLDEIRQLVMNSVQGRFLGIFGEDHINVLDLNLALDALK